MSVQRAADTMGGPGKSPYPLSVLCNSDDTRLQGEVLPREGSENRYNEKTERKPPKNWFN